MRIIESHGTNILRISGGVVFYFEDFPKNFKDELEAEGLTEEIQSNPKARMMRNVIDEESKTQIAEFGIFHKGNHYLTDS